MARGRMIDKVIILSKKINAVSEGAENLYYRLYVNTDDYGRFHADPKIIKGQIYTLRNVSIPTIKKRLAELIEVRGDKKKDYGLIEVYKSGGELYLEIIDFEGHQPFRKDYKRKHEFPMSGTKPNESVRTRTKSRSNLIKSKLIKSKLREKDLKTEISYDEEFEAFWKAWPKEARLNKQYAKGIFIARCKQGLLLLIQKCFRGYMAFLKNKKIHENFEQKVMYPSTFLNKGRFREYEHCKYKPPM